MTRLLCAVIWALAAAAAASAQSARPLTIPALREWTPAAGAFQISPDSRILVRDAALLSDAEVFAQDLAQLLGFPISVVDDPGAAAGAGDLALALGETDPRLGGEGYRLRISAAIEITAAQSAGAFYATRTVLQLLHENLYQGFAVPAGEALDWPRYPERGLMIDAGRQYFTPEWIAQHLKELAYLKMNYFHLHFSDDGGFRIESETHPEIVAEQHLTKQEVRDLVALAARYHITVTPELDMPGHLSGALAAHPELQLRDASGQPNASRLDITNPAALQFSQELIEELVPLFPGPYWHIGADEYMPEAELQLHPQLQTYAQAHYGANANHKDALLGFVNWADAIVRAHGKIARVWHDELRGGSAVAVDPDVVVEWWNNSNPLSDPITLGPQALLDLGHTIENSGWFPTYYNAGQVGQNLFPRPDMQKAYETWDVHQFAGAFFSPPVGGQDVAVPPEVIAPDEPRNLGAKVNVWNGDPVQPESEETIALGIRTFVRVVAQKTWQSPLLTPEYSSFEAIQDVVGHAPGYELDAQPAHTLAEPGAWPCALAGALGLACARALRSLGHRTRLPRTH
jgi:hexosaminidase